MSLAHESTDPFTPQARHLVVLSAGVSDPSSTKLLAPGHPEAPGQATSDWWRCWKHCVKLRAGSWRRPRPSP